MHVEQALKILDSLEAHGRKRKPKEKILKEQCNHETLKELFRLTYDWLTPYYVTDVSGFTTPEDATLNDAEQRFKQFCKILKQLNKRELSGHAARDELVSFFNKLSPLEAKWYRRVIKRDLRINIGTTTIKKIWPNLVSNYGVQLATNLEDVSTLDFPLYGEPKYDGFRITIVIKDGVAGCFTRNGRRNDNLQFIGDQLSTVIRNGVVDGEIFHQSWNTVSSVITTKPENMTDEKTEALKECKLWAFDYIELQKFDQGLDDTPLERRRKKLQELICTTDGSPRLENVALVPQWRIDSTADLENKYKSCIDQGYEGLMLKVAGSHYKSTGNSSRRNKVWLKVKPEETIDGVIVSLESGTGRNAHRLGKFNVRLDDGTVVGVGTGITDLQREDFWARREELPGKAIEFLVQKEGGTEQVATVRFPRFVRFRPDKDEN